MTRAYFFKTYRRYYRLRRWLRVRISSGGRLLVGVFFAAGVFGIDARKSLAYQVLALAFALLMASIIGVWLTRARFDVRRQMPSLATLGEPFSYTVQVTNQSKRVQGGVSIREVPQVTLPGFEEFHRLREPGYATRNWFDRYMGYPRWVWLTRMREGVALTEHPLATMRPDETVSATVEVIPHRRGQISLYAADVLCSEPLGLLRRVISVPVVDTFLVVPKTYAMPRFELGQGRRRKSPGTVDRMSFGGIDEFKGLREYRPGDALRHIDWRAWARLGQPMVKEFHNERSAGLTVALDTDGRPYSEQFEVAVCAAASLVAAGVSVQPTELAFVRPSSHHEGRRAELVLGVGRDHAMTLLASVHAHPSPGDRQRELLGRGLRADAVVVVLLGYDESRKALIEALRQRVDGDVVPLVVLAENAVAPDNVAWVRGGSLEQDLVRFAARLQHPVARAA